MGHARGPEPVVRARRLGTHYERGARRPASPLRPAAAKIVMITGAIVLALAILVFMDEIWPALDRLLLVSSGGD